MEARDWIIAVIACVTDFVLASGGAFVSVAVATDSASALQGNAIAVVLVTGLLAAARRLQAMVALPPMTSSDLAALHQARADRQNGSMSAHVMTTNRTDRTIVVEPVKP